MTTRYLVETFSDIVSMIQEELGHDSGDVVTTRRIKRDINEVYLQEICPDGNWYWLTKTIEIQAKAYFNTGTSTVTANSPTVTLTETPAISYKGYYFSTDGYNEVYRVAQHSANSSTLTLESPYSGTSGSGKDFRIWNDCYPLPADCSRTLEVRHDFRNKPLDAMGRQEFRALVSAAPRAQARPECYHTGALVKPTPYESVTGLPATATRASSGLVKTIKFNATLGSSEATSLLVPGDRIEVSGAGHYSYNGEWVVSSLSTTSTLNDTITFTVEERYTESSTADTGITVKKVATADNGAKYRELMLYPALFESNTTLKVDYLIKPQPLVEDDDEPLIPLEDRNVLVYGVLCRQWVKARDEETATRNERLFREKLAKMLGRTEDSMDLPKLTVSPMYLRGKRRRDKGFSVSPPTALGFAIGGGASGITGTANRAAVFDTNGRLASSSTVSTTELEYLDGATSNIQTQIDALNTLANGKIYIGNASNQATEVTPSGDVTISNTGVTAIGAGVIVDADVNASAAIALSKLAALTASRALVSDGSGVISASGITSTEVTYLDDVEPLTTFAMSDAQASAANVATWTVASFDSIGIEYSIKRGTNFEKGLINLVSDGTSVALAQGAVASLGSVGVTFTADVSGGSLRLRYTSTSTGTAPSMKYRLSKWVS